MANATKMILRSIQIKNHSASIIRDQSYIRFRIRDGQLLEQAIGKHEMVVKYSQMADKDEFTITYPRTKPFLDKKFGSLDELSAFHASFLGIKCPPDPWKTFKIVGWSSGRTVYPTASIENLPLLPTDILEKQEETKIRIAKEKEKKAKKEEKEYQIFTNIIGKQFVLKQIKQLIKFQRPKSSNAASFLTLRGLKL